MRSDVVDYQIGRYVAATSLAAVLEAVSLQNDNLTLPLYLWSILVFFGI